MHANALARGTVAIETCFSASADKEAMIVLGKGKQDVGISTGGQDAPSTFLLFHLFRPCQIYELDLLELKKITENYHLSV